MSDDVAGPEPANYRFIVANSLTRGSTASVAVGTNAGSLVTVGGIMSDTEARGRLLEISQPRRVDTFKGATWLVCVRSLNYPSRQPRNHYAVFIQRDRIIDSRLSVGIDQCEADRKSVV